MSARTRVLLVLNLVLATLLTHLYFITRYDFNWLDWDTATTTRSIEATMGEGSLTPSRPYPAGFAYQSLVGAIQSATGIPIGDLQQVVIPVAVGVVPMIIAISVFRYFSKGDWSWAAMGVLLLLQPEFILFTSRGTHEKATISLVLLLVLLLLSRTNTKGTRLSPREIGILLIIPSLVFYNCFFALLFFISLAIALLYLRFSFRLKPGGFLISIPSLGLIFSASFLTLYEPAMAIMRTATSYLDALILLLSGASAVAEPYASIGSSWTSSGMWIAVNTFTFFLVASSTTYLILSKMKHLNGATSRMAVSLFVGASVTLVLAVALDFLGGSSVTNLQIRWLPFWAAFALPLTVYLLTTVGRTVSLRLRRRTIAASIIALVMIVLPLSLMKATLDPGISNYWIHYDDSEHYVVDWTAQFGEGDVWGGVDYRIGSIFVFEHGYPSRIDLRVVTAEGPNGTDMTIASNLSRLQWERYGFGEIDLAGWCKVADVGAAAVYAAASVESESEQL